MLGSRHVRRMSSPKEIKDVFSKGDKFNLVWVPHLGDVGPLGLNFHIFKKKNENQTKVYNFVDFFFF